MQRWTAARKHEIIQAVLKHGDGARLTLLAQHGISEDEWQSWLAGWHRAGKSGLKVSAIRDARAAAE